MKRYESNIIRRKDNSLGEYKENNLLTDEMLKVILDEHNLTLIKINKNVYLRYNEKNIEFDVLIETETPTGIKRFISVELKESDIGKTIQQSIHRRDFVDYSYVLVNSSVKFIVEYILYVWDEYIRNKKIGFISSKENVFVLASKFICSDIEIKELKGEGK